MHTEAGVDKPAQDVGWDEFQLIALEEVDRLVGNV